MKRGMQYGILFFMVILITGVIHAQDNKARFGFGLSMGKEMVEIDNEFVTLFDAPIFSFPILFGSGFRIEPQIGFYKYTRNSDASDYRMCILFFGAGIFKGRSDGKLRPYIGGRVGLSRVAYKRDYKNTGTDSDDSRMDVVIAPTAGVSYFITPDFCFGGEFQVGYLIFGQWDDDDDVSESLFATKTVVFLRYYLN